MFGWAEGFWRAAFVAAAVLALLVVVDCARAPPLAARARATLVVALLVEIGLGLLLGAAVIATGRR